MFWEIILSSANDVFFVLFFLIFGFGQEVPLIGACVDGNWTIVGKTISLADSSACKVEWGRILDQRKIRL